MSYVKARTYLLEKKREVLIVDVGVQTLESQQSTLLVVLALDHAHNLTSEHNYFSEEMRQTLDEGISLFGEIAGTLHPFEAHEYGLQLANLFNTVRV